MPRPPQLPVLLAALLAFSFVSCTRTPRAPTQPVLSAQSATSPTCGGGPGASKGDMSGNEVTLVNLINNMRNHTGLANLPVNRTIVGVAQYHALDMAASHQVSLVARDGEDPFRRIVCSGGAASVATGVVAVGRGTDPQLVFEAIQADISAFSTLYSPTYTLSLSVGYNDGYWMIIIQ